MPSENTTRSPFLETAFAGARPVTFEELPACHRTDHAIHRASIIAKIVILKSIVDLKVVVVMSSREITLQIAVAWFHITNPIRKLAVSRCRSDDRTLSRNVFYLGRGLRRRDIGRLTSD